MFNSRTKNIRLIKIVAPSLLFLFITIYTVSRSINYAKGPHIEIFTPVNGSTISSSTTIISGKAYRINKITLNNNPISIDEAGNWEKSIIIFSGINQITVYAEDQFGRSVQHKLDIIGKINQ